MEKIWFKRKTYGWGWTPVTWQGWLVIGAYLAVVFLFVYIASLFSSPKAPLIFLVPIAFATALMIYVCYKKGESPRWQWGDSNTQEK